MRNRDVEQGRWKQFLALPTYEWEGPFESQIMDLIFSLYLGGIKIKFLGDFDRDYEMKVVEPIKYVVEMSCWLWFILKF